MRLHHLFEGPAPSRPRVFYRGTVPGNTQRIKTGELEWDRWLFVSSKRESAQFYGPYITVFHAKPEAKILYEGSAAFRSVAKGLFKPGTRILPSCVETVKRAIVAGYDAVWFKRQGDVGTVVMNPSAFTSVPEEEVA